MGRDLVLDRILLAITAGAAMAVPGCADRTLGDDEAGSETSGGTGEPTSGTTTGGVTGTVTGDGAGTSPLPPDLSAGGDDGDIKFDLPAPKFDVPSPPVPPDDCVDVPPPDLDCDHPVGPHQVLVYRCMGLPRTGSCEDLANDDILADARDCYPACDGGFVDVGCGPVDSFSQCCSWLVFEEGSFCPGRPFVVDGTARLSALVDREDWAHELAPDCTGLSASTRAALARAWAQDARFEHASVASFARFVLQLLAIGAPSELIAAAQTAMGDEREHARAFFGLARAYGGRAIGPAALDVGVTLGATDWSTIAAALAREGCIAETISAVQIRTAAHRCRDGSVRAVLQRIADEELAHAELAWTCLRWMSTHGGPELREHVAAVFRGAGRHVPHGADIDTGGADQNHLREHGRLDAGERLEVANRVLEAIIAPAFAELMAPWVTSADPGGVFDPIEPARVCSQVP